MMVTRKIFVFTILIIIFVGVAAGLLYGNMITGAKKEVLPISSWKSVELGKTTVEEMQKSLGKPLNISGTTYTYPSSSKYWPNEVYSQNNTVRFVREKIFQDDNRTLKAEIKNFTEAPLTLYGPESTAGIILVAYPTRGIAFLTNQNVGTIFEIWHFPSMTSEEFMVLPETKSYAKIEYTLPEPHL